MSVKRVSFKGLECLELVAPNGDNALVSLYGAQVLRYVRQSSPILVWLSIGVLACVRGGEATPPATVPQ